MTRVLMVEDDPEITYLLEAYLPRYGIELFSIATPYAALEKVLLERYDLILLDLGLPEMDGLELCRRFKEKHPQIPIVISTARADVGDKVAAFEIGADDYVAKPYEPRELVARIQALVKRYRRFGVEEEPTLFRVERERMQILREGKPLELTPAEFEIFALLLERREQVVSREFIANSVESLRWESSDRSIDVIVSRIRHKIGDMARPPAMIRAVRGVGYRYVGP